MRQVRGGVIEGAPDPGPGNSGALENLLSRGRAAAHAIDAVSGATARTA